ncbi:MSC_0624 family F1-like ATPase-associated membrane protein [Mycoplasma sp. 31_09]|uniref:MSC_0624 family F1-like ATPase-associated membrane protein n=1 Tax=unclassified Mycoplasma TaxID=2683645 RepID=UPI003AAB6E48
MKIKIKQNTLFYWQNLISYLIMGVLLLVSLFSLSALLGWKPYNTGLNVAKPFLPIENFLDISQPSFQGRNFVIIYNFIILLVPLILAPFWLARNGSKQPISFVKYLPWSILYLAIIIASFTILYAYPITENTNISHLLISTIPFTVLMLVNFAFEIYHLFYCIKVYTGIKKYIRNFIITNTAKFILLIAGWLLLANFINGNTPETLFTVKNNLKEGFRILFYNYTVWGVIAIIAIVACFICYWGFKVANLFVLENSQIQAKALSKQALNFNFYALALFAIWMFANIFIVNINDGPLMDRKPVHILWISTLVITFLLLIPIYFLLKWKPLSNLNKTAKGFILIILSIVYLFALLIIRMLNADKFNNYMVVLIIVISYFALLFIYKLAGNTLSYITRYTLVLIFASLTIAVFFTVLSALLNQGSNNLTASIPFEFTLVDIFIIIPIIACLLQVIIQLSIWAKATYIVYKYNKTQGASHETNLSN